MNDKSFRGNDSRRANGFAGKYDPLQKEGIMNEVVKDCLVSGLKSKGFILDFEVRADIDGGFECYIFSDSRNVVVIMGESVRSTRRGSKVKMAYKHYYCQIGDSEYLDGILDSEDLAGNPFLQTGLYGIMFKTLINRIKSYGTKNAGSFIRPLRNYDATGKSGESDPYPIVKDTHTLLFGSGRIVYAENYNDLDAQSHALSLVQ